MTSRRRALLIQAATRNPKYTVSIVNSLLLCQGPTPYSFTYWYLCYDFETDTANNTFIMTGPNMFTMDYQTAYLFEHIMLKKYCMKETTTGSTMYYFPSSCTYSADFDESTGLYSVTALGNIQVLTPIVSN